MSNKYSDPTINGESYAMFPVESFNKIMWRSGDARLSALLQTDPGQYLGEFRSMISMPATAEREAITLPILPWRVVTRKAGRDTYSRYSTTEMLFRPITARLRYVLYQRDAQGQKVMGENKHAVIVSVSKSYDKGSGFSPQKEVFGYVFSEEGNFATYGLLSLDGWASYISYDRAAREFEKIQLAEGKLPIYRLGTRGVKVNGETFPKTRKFNGGESVDIEALDLDKPMTIDADENFDAMWNSAQAWAKCPRWNAEKKVVMDMTAVPPSDDPVYVDENLPY